MVCFLSKTKSGIFYLYYKKNENENINKISTRTKDKFEAESFKANFKNKLKETTDENPQEVTFLEYSNTFMNRNKDNYSSGNDRKDRTLFLEFYNHSIPNYYADPDYDATIEDENKYEGYSIGSYLYNYKNGECFNTMKIAPTPNINFK